MQLVRTPEMLSEHYWTSLSTTVVWSTNCTRQLTISSKSNGANKHLFSSNR